MVFSTHRTALNVYKSQRFVIAIAVLAILLSIKQPRSKKQAQIPAPVHVQLQAPVPVQVQVHVPVQVHVVPASTSKSKFASKLNFASKLQSTSKSSSTSQPTLRKVIKTTMSTITLSANFPYSTILFKWEKHLDRTHFASMAAVLNRNFGEVILSEDKLWLELFEDPTTNHQELKDDAVIRL